jgi:hypothetical protein
MDVSDASYYIEEKLKKKYQSLNLFVFDLVIP